MFGPQAHISRVRTSRRKGLTTLTRAWHACAINLSGFGALIMMKYAVVLFAFAAVGLAAEKPKVSECFKVHSLLRADEEHYWAAWSNACSFTIDSVYVIVRFADESNKLVGHGVWGLHFITPGASRVTRFSTPARLADYRYVHVHMITTNSEEALHSPLIIGDPGPKASLEAPAAGRETATLINSPGGLPRLIGDPGPLVYQLSINSPSFNVPSFEKTALASEAACPTASPVITRISESESFGCRVGK